MWDEFGRVGCLGGLRLSLIVSERASTPRLNSRGHSRVKLQKEGPKKRRLKERRGKNCLTVADTQEDDGCPFIIGHRAFIV